MALLPCLSCNIRFPTALCHLPWRQLLGKKQTNKDIFRHLALLLLLMSWCDCSKNQTGAVHLQWRMDLLLICCLRRGDSTLELPKWQDQQQNTVRNTVSDKKTLFPSLFISTYTLVPAHSVTLRTIIMCVSGEIPTALSKVSEDQPPYRAESRWW